MTRRLQARRPEGGFTLVELLIVVLIIGLLASIAVPALKTALRKGSRAALVSEARDLYVALMRYAADNGTFPSTVALDRRTLEPLSAEGYLGQPDSLVGKLVNGQLTVYAATVPGFTPQFFTILQHKTYADVALLVAHTDVLFVGTGLDGVYLIQGGTLVPVDRGT